MRYSKQKEAILNTVKNTVSHPTAAWVYDRIRETIPNISLGTVYRNLRRLTLDGTITSFIPKDGVERFDGNTAHHHHLVCRGCGKIIDLPFMPADDIIRSMEKCSNCQIDGGDIIFTGLCSECVFQKTLSTDSVG